MPSATLIIMRHATASPDSPTGEDFARPLTTQGRTDAVQMGCWLRETFPELLRVLASPAERTRQTVAAVLEAWPEGTQPETRWHPALYLAEATLLVAALEQETTSPLLLVGHNPGLEDLVWHLLDGKGIPAHQGGLMPTAAAYALNLPTRLGPLTAGCATLISHMRPHLLGKQR